MSITSAINEILSVAEEQRDHEVIHQLQEIARLLEDFEYLDTIDYGG